MFTLYFIVSIQNKNSCPFQLISGGCFQFFALGDKYMGIYVSLCWCELCGRVCLSEKLCLRVACVHITVNVRFVGMCMSLWATTEAQLGPCGFLGECLIIYICVCVFVDV